MNQLEKLAAEETKKTTLISFKCGYLRVNFGTQNTKFMEFCNMEGWKINT